MSGGQPQDGRPPARVVELRGVIFLSARRNVVADVFIWPVERVDRWLAGLYRSKVREPLAMHAGLHVVLEDGREMVAEQRVGKLHEDFGNGLKWTPIEDFRARERGGWDVTVPATAFRNVDDKLVADTVARLNAIDGKPFLKEDCTAFIERAVGGPRLFADSPLLHRLGVPARVGDPALPLLRHDAQLDPRAERLLRHEALRSLPDAAADAGSANARDLARGVLAGALALGAGLGASAFIRRARTTGRRRWLAQRTAKLRAD